MSTNDTRYVIEMVNAEDGEAFYGVVDSAEALGDFVRVNAGDAATFRISVTDTDALAMLRIAETFEEETP